MNDIDFHNKWTPEELHQVRLLAQRVSQGELSYYRACKMAKEGNLFINRTFEAIRTKMKKAVKEIET